MPNSEADRCITASPVGVPCRSFAVFPKFIAAWSSRLRPVSCASSSLSPARVFSSRSATWIPGNWATDLAGGSKYNYTLLSVIMISNLMAILLQALSLKLGIVTGRDLAQACRDHFSRPVSFALWFICELAIAACDLAEVIGSAIALNLLFGIPLLVGVCITALDVLLVLFLQNKGFRYIEALVITLDRRDRRLLCLGAGGFAAGCGGHRQGIYSFFANRDRSRHALHRDRHSGRDRHAA